MLARATCSTATTILLGSNFRCPLPCTVWQLTRPSSRSSGPLCPPTARTMTRALCCARFAARTPSSSRRNASSRFSPTRSGSCFELSVCWWRFAPNPLPAAPIDGGRFAAACGPGTVMGLRAFAGATEGSRTGCVQHVHVVALGAPRDRRRCLLRSPPLRGVCNPIQSLNSTRDDATYECITSDALYVAVAWGGAS